MKNTTKLILGVTVAAAAGAAIGMLLAPEKGKDLQKKIAEGAKDWIAEFASLIKMGKDLANDAKMQGEEKLAQLSGELNEKL